MATPHLKMFVPADARLPTPTQIFHLFPRLPTELRIRIWYMGLQCQRLIRIVLRSCFLMDLVLDDQGKPRPESHKGPGCNVVADGYQMLSKLFRVSKESRSAAESFYRVHLSCWFNNPRSEDSRLVQPGTLYFNPDLDFLFIDCEFVNDIEQRDYFTFLHNLKHIHDPHGVGYLNLAIDHNGIRRVCLTHPSALDDAVKKSFIETLTQLRQVFLVHVQRTGRHVYGLLSGAVNHEFMLNPSFPILGKSLKFIRLRPDPRPIGRDLQKVFLNTEPRCLIYEWRQYCDLYLGRYVRTRYECRVLVAYDSVVPLYDYKDAQLALQKEEDGWVQMTSTDTRSKRVLFDHPGELIETAVGFWLFDVDAFGTLPESLTSDLKSAAPSVLNLTEYWPDLAVLYFPGVD